MNQSAAKNNWLLISILGVVICISLFFYFRDTLFYLFGDLSQLGEAKIRYKWWLYIHFGFASMPLFLGPFQFIPGIRNRYPQFHKTAGLLYIAGSIISALTVYVLLGTTYELTGAILSLGLLATIWLFVTSAAYIFIRRRNYVRHAEFMIRSYVCSLAFVLIRLLPEINNLTGIFNFIEGDEMKRTVYEWICWVYPIMFTEFWLVWRIQLSPFELKRSTKNLKRQ